MTNPKLRFKNKYGQEYPNWEEGLLSSFAEINPKSEHIPEKFNYIDLECVISGKCTCQRTINKADAPSRAKRLLKYNDILFQMVRPYQKNNLLFTVDKQELASVASTGYAQLRCSLNQPGFLYQLLHTQNFLKHVLDRCTGGAYPAINAEELGKIIISYPDIEEQQKIASFFSTLDEKISLSEHKLEALKKFKRGLMQKIFSRKIRFKPRNEASFADWVCVQLNDCCNCYDNLRKPIKEGLRTKGMYPYYGANGIQDYVDSYIFDGEYILLAEDGGNFNDFQSKPIARYVSGKIWVNNHAHIIKAKEGISNKFVFYSLEHKDIRSFINGSTRGKLTQSDMWSIEIDLPSDVVEQQKIASFFSTIDDKISFSEQKLQALKILKKGLMQQMFV